MPLTLGSLSDFHAAKMLQIGKQPNGAIDGGQKNRRCERPGVAKKSEANHRIFGRIISDYLRRWFTPGAHIFYHLAQSCHHGVAALPQITYRFMGL
jgi:hypothetical protein